MRTTFELCAHAINVLVRKQRVYANQYPAETSEDADSLVEDKELSAESTGQEGLGSHSDTVIELGNSEQAEIGRQLRNLYDELTQEELPQEISRRLEELQRKLQEGDGD